MKLARIPFDRRQILLQIEAQLHGPGNRRLNQIADLAHKAGETDWYNDKPTFTRIGQQLSGQERSAFTRGEDVPDHRARRIIRRERAKEECYAALRRGLRGESDYGSGGTHRSMQRRWYRADIRLTS